MNSRRNSLCSWDIIPTGFHHFLCFLEREKEEDEEDSGNSVGFPMKKITGLTLTGSVGSSVDHAVSPSSGPITLPGNFQILLKFYQNQYSIYTSLS